VFTRCKACHTVHPVNAALLAQNGGRYRCGKCNQTNDALAALFDEWPAAGDRPPSAGDMPVLGLAIDLEAAARARLEPADATPVADGGKPAAGYSRAARYGWIALVVATLIAVIFLSADYFDRPLPMRDTLVRLGLLEPSPSKPYRNLSHIHLVSRDLRTHPERPGALQLSATIVNRAARTQPYPVLEVTLLDAAGGELARQRFEPKEYLARGIPRDSGMTPQAYLPLILELDDPGEQAVGFEINFQ
jgi:predicted Zn finger-like uncharacterized protein